MYGTLGFPIYLLLTNMVLEFVIGWLFSKAQSTSAFVLRILFYFLWNNQKSCEISDFLVFLV